MIPSASAITAFLALAHAPQLTAFSPSISHHIATHPSTSSRSHNPPPRSPLHSSPNNDEENPYSDPNFPDIEFINYDDPTYSAGQDDEDSSYTPSSPLLSEEETLVEIEAMRESRRRRNDEYQFETYHSSVLRGGSVSLGEWTVFQTDTFMDELAKGRSEGARHVPRLLKWDKVLKVVSRGYKVITDENAEWRVDGERIVHEEKLAEMDNFPVYDLDDSATEDMLNWEEQDRLHVENTFWPNQLESIDFRGPGGNMCVGKAYTICDAVPLSSDRRTDEGKHEGPFREMRTELGVADGGMRFRVKLDYATLEEDGEGPSPPPLHLRTLTVCRETLDGYWPNPSDNGADGEDATISDEMTARRKNQRAVDAALFGPPGAPGGLYDPPPVGSEERATQNYMLLDFEGGATVLLPHRLDQNDESEGYGWVTSLDWTPGKIRYQVDRKVFSGKMLKGLKTLELSEVVGEDADRWRPKDGGADMRQ